MTPSTTPSSELFRLQGALVEFLSERDELYQQLGEVKRTSADSPEDEAMKDDACEGLELSIKALESGIGSYLLERIRSVDDIRNPLLAMQAAQKVCEAEATRATNQALVWQRQIATVLDMVKVCMKHLDDLGTWKPKESRKLQSALGSISLVGNGGKQPVEIADESLIPEEFIRATVTMPLTLWEAIIDADFGDDDINAAFGTIKPKLEPSKSAIEAELNKPCEWCKGTGSDQCLLHGHTDIEQFADGHFICGTCGDSGRGEDAELEACPQCGGTARKGVPGAHLADRDSHVRISGLTK